MRTQRDISGVYFFHRLADGSREPRCFEELDAKERINVMMRAEREFVESLAHKMLDELRDLAEFATGSDRNVLGWMKLRTELLELALKDNAARGLEGLGRSELNEKCDDAARALYDLAEHLDVAKG